MSQNRKRSEASLIFLKLFKEELSYKHKYATLKRKTAAE